MHTFPNNISKSIPNEHKSHFFYHWVSCFKWETKLKNNLQMWIHDNYL